MAKSNAAKIETDEQAGLSPTECPFDCSRERCVISGANFCGHPNKGGGSQPRLQADPAAVKRYNRARKTLAVEAAKKK